jgi:hypothetical protein
MTRNDSGRFLSTVSVVGVCGRISRHEGRHLRQYRRHRRYELGAAALANRRHETRPRVTRRLGEHRQHRSPSTLGAENQEVGGN